ALEDDGLWRFDERLPATVRNRRGRLGCSPAPNADSQAGPFRPRTQTLDLPSVPLPAPGKRRTRALRARDRDAPPTRRCRRTQPALRLEQQRTRRSCVGPLVAYELPRRRDDTASIHAYATGEGNGLVLARRQLDLDVLVERKIAADVAVGKDDLLAAALVGGPLEDQRQRLSGVGADATGLVARTRDCDGHTVPLRGARSRCRRVGAGGLVRGTRCVRLAGFAPSSGKSGDNKNGEVLHGLLLFATEKAPSVPESAGY